MNNLINESGNDNNVSAGCKVDKAVDIINKADDVNIDLTEYSELNEETEKPINPDVVINAAIDIKNTMDELKKTDGNNPNIPTTDNTNNINNNNNTDSELVKYGNRYITKEQRSAYCAKGGSVGGERVRKRKTAKEILGNLLQAQLQQDSIDEILGESAQILGEDKTVYAVMCAKMIQIACAGDIKAFIAIRDTVGDKPADEHLITADVMTDEDRRLIDNLKKRMDKQALSLHND